MMQLIQAMALHLSLAHVYDWYNVRCRYNGSTSAIFWSLEQHACNLACDSPSKNKRNASPPSSKARLATKNITPTCIVTVAANDKAVCRSNLSVMPLLFSTRLKQLLQMLFQRQTSNHSSCWHNCCQCNC